MLSLFTQLIVRKTSGKRVLYQNTPARLTLRQRALMSVYSYKYIFVIFAWWNDFHFIGIKASAPIPQDILLVAHHGWEGE